MLKIFKRLTAKEIIMMIIAVLFVCLNVFLDLKIPDYMSDITSLLSTQGTKSKRYFCLESRCPRYAYGLAFFRKFCSLCGCRILSRTHRSKFQYAFA